MGKASIIDGTRQDTQSQVEAPTCQHHWLIETPRGAMSRGRCKRCGEERDFRNSAQDYLWEDESGSSYNAWRGVRSSARVVADDDEVAASPGSREPALTV